ncbi:MAG TPA: HEAT repeat domain-containing protein [Isosphaeraceae bacterium]
MHRRRGRTERLLPALIRATKDPDPECRVNALKAASAQASLYASEPLKDRVLRNSLAAMHDPDETVRAAALGSTTSGLGRRDAETFLGALRAALNDPSVGVRRAAAEQLGMLAAVQPETQADVAPILLRVLASREEPSVRAKAIAGVWLFGMDRRRDPACLDVVPDLVAALRDPEVEVRRMTADVLGRTTIDSRCRPVSDWDLRKATIIPTIERALTDEDRTMREESALALFGLGRRDPAIIELMEKGAGDPDRRRQYRFAKAITAWKEESEIAAETSSPGEVPPPGRDEIAP